MRRRNVQNKDQGAVPVYADCDGTRMFPSIAAFVRDQEYDDGAARATGTLLLFVEEGRYKVWLHDREEECGCFLSNTTLLGLLAALEAGLREDDLEWRIDKEGSRVKKK